MIADTISLKWSLRVAFTIHVKQCRRRNHTCRRTTLQGSRRPPPPRTRVPQHSHYTYAYTAPRHPNPQRITPATATAGPNAVLTVRHLTTAPIRFDSVRSGRKLAGQEGPLAFTSHRTVFPLHHSTLFTYLPPLHPLLCTPSLPRLTTWPALRTARRASRRDTQATRSWRSCILRAPRRRW